MSEPILFNGQVVLVTGGSRGIGRSVANMFAERKAIVVVNGRNKAVAEQSAEEITQAGGHAVAIVGDIANAHQASGLVSETLNRFGRIDVVINNAGILSFAPFRDMSEASLNEVFDVNLRGAFNVTQAAWPHMLKAGYGRVVFFPSHAVFGSDQSAHYALSKAALIGLMRSLHVEGKSKGIHLNAVMPFAVTDMMLNAMSSGASIVDGNTDDLAQAAQFLHPHLIAPLVGWISHQSCEVSGEIFTAGGGRVARVFLAETQGYFNPDQSTESVRDHWTEIIRENGYKVPHDLTESLGMVVEALKKSQ